MRERWTRATPPISIGAEEAQRLIAPALPDAKVRAVELVEGGFSNTNLRVVLESAPGAVLLRLWQRDPSQAKKEAALAKLLEGRVPVARVLHLGERGSAPYAVLDWIEGERLESIAPTLGFPDLAFLARHIGRVLATIHSVTFAQAGFLGPALAVTPFPSFALADYLKACVIDGAGAKHIDAALAARVVALAEANGHLLDSWSEPPRLTHFDFGGSNILVATRNGAWEVSGVVDWEFAASSSPAADFGNLLRPPLGRLPGFADAVAQGYRAGGGAMPENWRTLVRLSDLAAWAEFLTREHVDERVVSDATRVFETALREAQ
jgi:aminoglycoside phosphotransferase (APT) family kinase protein